MADDKEKRRLLGIEDDKPLPTFGKRKPKPVWLNLDDEYLPRFGWINEDRLWVQTLNRGQDDLKLLSFDTRGRDRRVLLEERDDYWINIGDDLAFLDDGGFLWASERSGFRHIYRYGSDGALQGPLTSGDWEVQSIEAVDEDAGGVDQDGAVDQ